MRVMLKSAAILRTPTPSPPTSSAGVPSSVSSAVGSARVPSLAGVADVNHLVPYSRYVPPSHRAIVDVPLTSDPPVRSIIHCPDVQKRAGSREVSRVSARARRSSLPYNSSARAAPSLIASGQLYVADDGPKRYIRTN